MMTPIWLGNQLENEQAAVPGRWPGAKRWQRGCRRAVTLLFSPSSFPLHRDPTRQPFSANASVTASDRRAEYA